MTKVPVKVAKRGCLKPDSSRAAAAASLRISNAMPAAPAGNIEKSLCTVWRLTVFQLGRNAKGGIPGQFFRRSRIVGVRSILKLLVLHTSGYYGSGNASKDTYSRDHCEPVPI